MKQDEILKIFTTGIRNLLVKANLDYDKVYEIRLRVNGPLVISYQGKEWFLSNEGRMVKSCKEAYRVSQRDIRETMEFIAGYSLYAYEEELKQGFITIQGGHRVGLAGKVITDGEHIQGMKYISCINVRISHEIKGCADVVIPYVLERGNVCHTLIISPPRCGKTTLLRDLIRQLSDGVTETQGYTVAVVDERSEIGGCYEGVPQNDIGIRTDVLDCCPKAQGMMMLIRSMAPDVVAVDELGDYEDVHAIETVIHCGCKLLATVHGTSIDDIGSKPLFQRLMNEHVFQRYIILDNYSKMGNVKSIFNERGTCLYECR